MNEKGLRSPVFRRVITIVLLLGISGTFLAMYYLVYLPQQQTDFNKRMFRILSEIANNFSIRTENFGTVSDKSSDIPVKLEAFSKAFSPSYNALDSLFDSTFKNSFRGNPDNFKKNVSYHFEYDTIRYQIGKNVIDSSKRVLISEILDPLISIHANTFESVLLINSSSGSLKKDNITGKIYDSILYKSSEFDIANINTDSLFQNKNLQAAELTEINIEGTKYKMFLMPFRMKIVPDRTFVLAGIISKHDYNKQSQSIPVDFLVTVVVILILLLLCLPLLKVFVLSPEENITIADVRFIIASIFIIPLVITLISSAAWLYIYPERFTLNVLRSLQDEIKDNFYKEIQQCINQANTYDSAITNPAKAIIKNYVPDDTISSDVKTVKENMRNTVNGIDSMDLKDVAFYPVNYKNLEVVHWMDSTGKDIASWRFTKVPTTYFDLKEREYFKNVKYKKMYTHPCSGENFTMEAVLSKSTGEFILNIAVPSHVVISPQRKSIAIAVTSKMYSLHNTVVPSGFEYCLIDQKGDIIFHSDTARNLQENLLQESADNHLLQNALSHKDSSYIDNVRLYDEPVKMMIKPLDDMPYYLVTYYKKRGEYLFITHIIAFVFLCMSLLHLFVSLFSYCVMMTNRRLTKLLFFPSAFSWLKPSYDRKDYYVRNCLQLIASILLIILFSAFLQPEQQQLYKLNYALLLPLFTVTGYYIVKSAKGIIDLQDNSFHHKLLLLKKEKFLSFLFKIKNILLLYFVSISVFGILQNVLFYYKNSTDAVAIQVRIFLLIVLIPLVVFFISVIDINYLRSVVSNVFGRMRKVNEDRHSSKHYLIPFIISLMLSVLTITVIPAITLTSYAFNEEKKLHFQTFQVELAKRIQERRVSINPKFWQTKLSMYKDSNGTFKAQAGRFIDSLKFVKERGLYLGGLSIDTAIVENALFLKGGLFVTAPFTDSFKYYNADSQYLRKLFDDSIKSFSANLISGSATRLFLASLPSNPETVEHFSSPFYKIITRFLFLPPDHDEFYDNESHSKFYYWTVKKTDFFGSDAGVSEQSLNLHYKNLTDHRNSASFILTGRLQDFYLFKDLTCNPLTLIIILIIIILIILFSKLIHSLAKRIFMIDFFNDNSVTKDKSINNLHDSVWLKEKFEYADLEKLSNTECFNVVPGSFKEIKKNENQLLKQGDDECILKIHLALIPAYESIWRDCTDIEKFTLYDFALDGFTNYKKVIVLFQLYQKGLLIKDKDNFDLMTYSFRNFLLTKEKSGVIKELSKQGKGSWSTMRTVFYVILLAVAIFIFMSQEEASKRLITIVTSMGALLPAILKLFDKSTVSTATNKSS